MTIRSLFRSVPANLTTRASSIRPAILAAAAVVFVAAGSALATGPVYLTGRDPDFHATLGGNTSGARLINQVAIEYILNPSLNPFAAGGNRRFLFVESQISPPAGHTPGINGIIASGYVSGVNFDRVSAAGLNSALNGLGTTYAAIVVASDFGGLLTQSELDILNSRSADIGNFLGAGGGLYAMAQGNGGAGLTPGGGRLNFVPAILGVANAPLDQSESGNTLSPLGVALGLTTSSINGNASHTYFTSFGSGLAAVDFDAAGRTITVAGLIPSPSASALLGLGGLLAARRRGR